MRKHVLFVALLAALMWGAAGCAQGELSEDETEDDAGETRADAGPDEEDADSGPQHTPPQFYHTTSGGDLSTSDEHRMQMNFGAPLPRGTAENDEYRIHYGPVSP
ncbi:MAG: hypothetical protein ACOCV2_10135 [Persicimonas sp.]